MTVDPLAEVVTSLRPVARFSKLVELAGTWRMRRAGTGAPFYAAVMEGACRITLAGEPAITLQAGDFLLTPALHDLVIESPDATPKVAFSTPREMAPGCFRAGARDRSPDTRLQIGHCSFGSPDAELLVSLLPQIVVARGEPRLGTVVQLLDDESRARRAARELVLERLLEVLLIEAVRCGGETGTGPGLARGLADDRVAAALRSVHARPEHPWTMTELAGEAALSRSAFFARFSRTVGVPPMEYLLTWRMALAKRLLHEQELGIDEVAQRVGYGSASTFTVAFSRRVGMPPARYARTQLARSSDGGSHREHYRA